MSNLAEFCIECFNRIMGADYALERFIISKDYDLCEECGEIKPIIVRVKRRYLLADALKERIEYWKTRE